LNGLEDINEFGAFQRYRHGDAQVLDFFHHLFQLDAPCDSLVELGERLVNLAPRIVVLERGHQVPLKDRGSGLNI